MGYRAADGADGNSARLPRLKTLNIPTLVITGDSDFIPGEVAAHIAQAIPNARFVTLKDCGHFAYLECPDDVRRAVPQARQRMILTFVGAPGGPLSRPNTATPVGVPT